MLILLPGFALWVAYGLASADLAPVVVDSLGIDNRAVSISWGRRRATRQVATRPGHDRGAPMAVGVQHQRAGVLWEGSAMSYTPAVAAALSGATLRQLSHWRRGPEPVLAPVQARVSGRVFYSFRDVVALRAIVYLRGKNVPLQRFRKALVALRAGVHDGEHSARRRDARLPRPTCRS